MYTILLACARFLSGDRFFCQVSQRIDSNVVSPTRGSTEGERTAGSQTGGVGWRGEGARRSRFEDVKGKGRREEKRKVEQIKKAPLGRADRETLGRFLKIGGDAKTQNTLLLFHGVRTGSISPPFQYLKHVSTN